ncbi:papain-like cysteine protease family protein [Methylobacterium cerastii]|uniref:papain-like cysteine protease family protein n=1 Tax=Methylobacterium cerastii TaxID=932741 RepID=UPI001EE1C7F3|nr:papain-like cysteine protease family protein [Methylobacterium cerastii]
MSGKKNAFSRARPPYEFQQRPDNCWSACLQMWLRAEIGVSPSQDQLNGCVGDFSFTPGRGIDTTAIGDMVDKAVSSLTISMDYKLIEKANQLPNVKNLLVTKGYIYVAYRRANGSGHVNIISAYNGDSYGCSDPDPDIRNIVRSKAELFSHFPMFVGWRHRVEGELFSL